MGTLEPSVVRGIHRVQFGIEPTSDREQRNSNHTDDVVHMLLGHPRQVASTCSSLKILDLGLKGRGDWDADVNDPSLVPATLQMLETS